MKLAPIEAIIATLLFAGSFLSAALAARGRAEGQALDMTGLHLQQTISFVGLIGDANIVTLGAAQAFSADVQSTDIAIIAGNNNSLTVAGSIQADLVGCNNSMNFTDPAVLTPDNAASRTDTNPVAEAVSLSITGSGDHITQTLGNTSLIKIRAFDTWISSFDGPALVGIIAACSRWLSLSLVAAALVGSCSRIRGRTAAHRLRKVF